VRSALRYGLLLVLWIGVGCATSGPPPPSTPHPLLGQAAPSFRRATVQGTTVANSPGRVMVIEFFARWCIPCQRRLPAVEKLRSDLSDVIFVGVSLDQRPQDAIALVRVYRLGFPVILDPDRVLAGRFRVTELPAVIVVGKDGRVAWFGGAEQLEDALRRAVLTARSGDLR
jgi:thiol-disulfide isomerase/thioredoxin